MVNDPYLIPASPTLQSHGLPHETSDVPVQVHNFDYWVQQAFCNLHDMPGTVNPQQPLSIPAPQPQSQSMCACTEDEEL